MQDARPGSVERGRSEPGTDHLFAVRGPRGAQHQSGIRDDDPHRGQRRCFVHGSDIQLLDGEAVSLILAWRPGIVLVGGPPLYLPWLSLEQRERAWKSALRLAGAVDTLILDHHLLRSEEGLSWLECLVSKTSHRVMCAAGFMKHPIRLLEPWRAKLYDEMAVPEGWHEVYARGEADTSAYSEHQFSIPTVGPARRHKWPSPRPLENG